METVEVPITRGLSTDPKDVVGKMQIESSLADQIAALAEQGFTFRLETGISIDKKPVLQVVSIAGDPVKTKYP